MTVINTNVSALTARTYAVQANKKLQNSMERLSSGLRINSAADDAAGMAVANKMESQLRGMNAAIRNSQDGISLVQTAEAGISEITNMIIRMRELAVQMNNGVYTNADRTNAQLEVTALLSEVDKIAENTAFNDVKVLDGTYATDIRAGNTNAEAISIKIDSVRPNALGGETVPSDMVDAIKINSVAARTTIFLNADEGNVAIPQSELSQALRSYASSTVPVDQTNGTYSIILNENDQNSVFSIDPSTGDISLSDGYDELDFESPLSSDGSNTYIFKVKYEDLNGGAFIDRVVLTINDLQPSASNSTSIIATVEEGNELSANISLLSNAFKEFRAEHQPSGTLSIAADSSGSNDYLNFDITSDGTITLSSSNLALDYEAPLDNNGDNIYKFSVVYTAQDGVTKFTEEVELRVTNFAGDSAVIPASSTETEPEGYAALKVGSNAAQNYTDLANGTHLSNVGRNFVNNASGPLNFSMTGGTFTTLSTGGRLTVNVDNFAPNEQLLTVTITDQGTGQSFTEMIQLTNVYHPNSGNSDLFSRTESSATTTSSFSGVLEAAQETEINLAGGLFSELDNYASSFTGGTYSIQNITRDGSANSDVTIDNINNNLVFSGDAGAGTYVFDIIYNDSPSSSITQTVTATMTKANAPSDTVTPARLSVGVNLASQNAALTKVDRAITNLTLNEGRQGLFSVNGTLSNEIKNFVSSEGNGVFVLSGDDANHFTVDKLGYVKSKGLIDYETKNSYDLTLEYISGASRFKESISIEVINNPVDDGQHLEDINIATKDSANLAIEILDVALNQVIGSRAKLGAVQNRLEYNINNLSNGSRLTETARGRIVDADFARETSELSKQQILGQAATSMLAQANQSKQSVLALLQ